MKFAVTVTLKKDVLDPQGKVVGQTLKNMGIKNLEQIRQGKFFEIYMNEKDAFNLRLDPNNNTEKSSSEISRFN